MTTRPILNPSRIHPAAAETMNSRHAETIREVEKAIADNAVVVVGMAQNPHVKNVARRSRTAGIEFAYLEYGSYFSESGTPPRDQTLEWLADVPPGLRWRRSDRRRRPQRRPPSRTERSARASPSRARGRTPSRRDAGARAARLRCARGSSPTKRKALQRARGGTSLAAARSPICGFRASPICATSRRNRALARANPQALKSGSGIRGSRHFVRY